TGLGRKLERKEIPPYLSERSLVEEEVFRHIIPFNNFDLIIQGRSEGEGCYCSINNILKHLIKILAENYKITIIDSPAGLEFFARKTSLNVDDLILVTDPSKMSFHTLQRILEVKDEVSLDFKNIWVLGNRFNGKIKNLFIESFKKNLGNHMKLLGFLSYDGEIQKFNLSGKSLLELPSNNVVYQQANKIFSQIV
ncbi:ATP-binding protein, partial [Candidatus Aerophobetes bacterium Ae_b3b]